MSTIPILSERQRAKQIFAEIIRSAGGMLNSKTELLRVFWQAHLVFAESQLGYLSLWPILKTSAGPVIKDVDRLLGELVADGRLQFDETKADGLTGLQLELTGKRTDVELSAEAIAAIASAVAHPGEPVDLSRYSTLRSWNEASDGDELNIYVDVIPDAEYADRKQRLQDLKSALDSAW